MMDSLTDKAEEHRSGQGQDEPTRVGISRYWSTATRQFSDWFQKSSLRARRFRLRSLSTDSNEAGPAARRWYSQAPGCRGLVNIGNTCYMNSALQCLSDTAPLREYFTDGSCGYHCDINGTCATGLLAEAFSALLVKMWAEPEASRFAVSNDLKAIQRNVGHYACRFSSYSQHDSQEFLFYLLEGLHEELNKPIKHAQQDKMASNGACDEENSNENETAEDAWAQAMRSDNSIIACLFQGLLKTNLTCGNEKCGKKIYTCDAFKMLPLPLPNEGVRLPKNFPHMVEDIGSERTFTLMECLELMTEETSTGKKSWFCEGCSKSVELKRKVDILRAPEILILYLKRFDASRSGRYKLCTCIDFPEHYFIIACHFVDIRLDLSPFLLQRPDVACYYDLYATIDHHGSIRGGHYTATVKHGDKWCLFDDNVVSQFDSLQEIKKTTSVYVLFYERRHDKPIVSPLASKEICHEDKLASDRMKASLRSPPDSNEHACTGKDSSVDADSYGSFMNIPVTATAASSSQSIEDTMETDERYYLVTAGHNFSQGSEMH